MKIRVYLDWLTFYYGLALPNNHWWVNEERSCEIDNFIVRLSQKYGQAS